MNLLTLVKLFDTNIKRELGKVEAVRDFVNTSVGVQGATVTLPTSIGTVLQATTDANGIALFPAANNINVPTTVQAIVSRTGYVTAISNFFSRTSTNHTTTILSIRSASNDAGFGASSRPRRRSS